MSILADALQPHIVGELTASKWPLDVAHLPDVILKDRAAFLLAPAAEGFSIDFRTREVFVDALAGDVNRLLCATVQSVVGTDMQIVDRDSTAWTIIKLYYAAFYAANALIRMTGASCSYFTSVHARQLNRYAAAMSIMINPAIESGLYRCHLGRSTTELVCRKARGGSGGTHDAFWLMFGEAARIWAAEILTGPLVLADAQKASSQIENMISILSRRNGFNWLSNVRNDVQYRHAMDVWFPYGIKSKERRKLQRAIGLWQHDPMDISIIDNRDLESFINCCCFIISASIAVMHRIASRSSIGEKLFLKRGPIHLLNSAGIRM